MHLYDIRCNPLTIAGGWSEKKNSRIRYDMLHSAAFYLILFSRFLTNHKGTVVYDMICCTQLHFTSPYTVNPNLQKVDHPMYDMIYCTQLHFTCSYKGAPSHSEANKPDLYILWYVALSCILPYPIQTQPLQQRAIKTQI